MKQNRFFYFLYFSFFGFLLFTVDVQAYVDPSVMTYAIQAVAGMAITLGTVAGLYGRKILAFLRAKQGMPAADIRTDDLEFRDPKTGEVRRALGFMDEARFSRLASEREAAAGKNDVSLRTGLIVTFAVSFLWMVYSPLMLYLSNPGEFKYDFYSILPAAAVMFAAVFAAGAVVYLFSLKAARPVYVLLVILGFSFFVITLFYGNFMTWDLPALDGTAFGWKFYKKDMILSVFISLAVIAGVGLLYKKYGFKILHRTIAAITAVSVLFLGVTMFLTGLHTGGFRHKRLASVTTEEEFTFSSDQNLIVLVIDAADSGVFRSLLEENPAYKEVFQDFTYYPDTVGSYTYTEHAVPFILTGKWMENQEAFETFETEAMDASPLFKTLEEKGYRMGLYEDSLVYESDGIYRFENVRDDHYKLDLIGEYARQSFFMTWFQYMPYALKPLLSSDDTLSNIQNRAVGQKEAYTGNNTRFYSAIKHQDILLSEDPCFRFIHIEGAHVPFRYDKDMNEIPTDEGSYEQNMQASITIADAFLNKLRENGVYDNSAIVILADHGYSDDAETLLARSNPILLIKGFGESHPLKISEQPISHEDLQQTFQDLLNGSESKDLYTWADNAKRARRFLSYDYNHATVIEEFYQYGKADDFDSMKSTGTIYTMK